RREVRDLLAAAVGVSAGGREAALRALQQLDPPWPRDPAAEGAVWGLVSKMSSPVAGVRGAACQLLSQIGQPAVPALEGRLYDRENDTLQVMAARMLGRIGPGAVSAVPALTHELTSEHAHVRQAAAEALAQIGEPAADALPALVLLLADWHALVR